MLDTQTEVVTVDQEPGSYSVRARSGHVGVLRLVPRLLLGTMMEHGPGDAA